MRSKYDTLATAMLRAFTLPALLLLASAGYADLVRSGPKEHVFKTTPQGELKIHVFFPAGWKASDHRPAILFLFGGGFITGSPDQLFSKAAYFASRGMVAAASDYRTKSKHDTLPGKSVEDAASAVRWLRTQAPTLGVDPKRIVAAGASAGGTAAAVIAVTDEFSAHDEDASVSSRPDALVLLNPAMGTISLPVGARKPAEEVVRSWAQMYAHFERPQNGNPPTVMFFGTTDSLLAPGKTYFRKSLAAGNRIELFLAPGVGHGFFNDPRSTGADGKLAKPGWHEAALRKIDEFLIALGYLRGSPVSEIPADAPAVFSEEH